MNWVSLICNQEGWLIRQHSSLQHFRIRVLTDPSPSLTPPDATHQRIPLASSSAAIQDLTTSHHHRCCATRSPRPGLSHSPKPLLLEAAARESLADGVPVLRSHSRRANSKTLNAGLPATRPVPHLSCRSPLGHVPACSSNTPGALPP